MSEEKKNQAEKTTAQPETPNQAEKTTAQPEAPNQAEKKAAQPETPKQANAGKTKNKKPPATPSRITGGQVLRGLYIALTIVSAIIVVGYIFMKLFAAPPTVDNPDNPVRPAATRPPVVIETTDPITGEIIEVEVPALSGDRKEEFYTFLMVGVSQESGGSLTDTMMLAAYDVPNQKLSIMSLPRDIYVNYSGTRLLNNVYTLYNGGGVDGLKKAVQQLTGVYPDFYAVIQWEALGELVDAIGGIEYEVPFDMYYNDLSQHFKIDLKAGKQVLDGNGAMGLIRWRHNSDDYGHISSTYGYREGDIGRVKTQQSFLKAVIKKCLQPGVLLTNLTEYLTIFQENVETDLKMGELAYFAQAAVGGLNMENVNLVILPYRDAGDGAHLLPNGRQIVAEINSNFNPYKEDIHVGELRLASEDDVPKPSESPDPEETVDPDATPDPDATVDPDATHDPEESHSPDDPLLPPGVLVRPSASPSGSPRPSASASPSGSPRPSASADPSASPSPSASAAPGGLIRPGESAAPSTSPSTSPTPTGSSHPETSPSPSGSAAPGGGLVRPSESAAPEATETPKPAETPVATETTRPAETPTATETTRPTEAPKPTPIPDDEPLLPPGV